MEIKINLIRGTLGKVPPVCVLPSPVPSASILAPAVALPVLETKQKLLALGGTGLSGGLGIVASWPLPRPRTQSKAPSGPNSLFGHLGTGCPICASQKADLFFPLGQSRSIVHNRPYHADGTDAAVLPVTFLYVACGCIQMPNSD